MNNVYWLLAVAVFAFASGFWVGVWVCSPLEEER